MIHWLVLDHRFRKMPTKNFSKAARVAFAMKITSQLFHAFIRCRFKLHLLATEQEGVAQQYGELLEDLDRRYRDEAILGPHNDSVLTDH
jgi:hypothetical protein